MEKHAHSESIFKHIHHSERAGQSLYSLSLKNKVFVQASCFAIFNQLLSVELYDLYLEQVIFTNILSFCRFVSYCSSSKAKFSDMLHAWNIGFGIQTSSKKICYRGIVFGDSVIPVFILVHPWYQIVWKCLFCRKHVMFSPWDFRLLITLAIREPTSSLKFPSCEVHEFFTGPLSLSSLACIFAHRDRIRLKIKQFELLHNVSNIYSWERAFLCIFENALIRNVSLCFEPTISTFCQHSVS